MRNKAVVVLLALLGVAIIFIFVDGRNEKLFATSVIDPKEAESRQYGPGALAESPASLSRAAARVDLLIARLDNRYANLGADERIQAAEELGKEYFYTLSDDLRRNISDALSHSLRLEKDAQVARAITFSHSRLAYDKNTLSNLKFSYDQKFIHFEDYYGELAHLYDEAPPEDRRNVIGEISKGNSRYAVDVVAAKIAFVEEVQLSDQEVSDLRSFLNKNRPIFAGAEDSFGLFEAILYNQWLVAVSRLQSTSEGGSVEKWMGRRLLDPSTDPRASVAFLIGPYAKILDDSKKAELQWDAVRARATELLLRYPQAPGLQELGKDMAP